MLQVGYLVSKESVCWWESDTLNMNLSTITKLATIKKINVSQTGISNVAPYLWLIKELLVETRSLRRVLSSFVSSVLPERSPRVRFIRN